MNEPLLTREAAHRGLEATVWDLSDRLAQLIEDVRVLQVRFREVQAHERMGREDV